MHRRPLSLRTQLGELSRSARRSADSSRPSVRSWTDARSRAPSRTRRSSTSGSGSGLFSLAAMRLGAARVHSFDYDARQRRRARASCVAGIFPRCSTLDRGAGQRARCRRIWQRLGHWDVVYSWGVLHHTGDMWTALKLVTQPRAVRAERLFIALYNDQGPWSAFWTRVKRSVQLRVSSARCRSSRRSSFHGG